ncbi:MAG: hypothetical protein IPL86_16955 [Flavobacteriales bacterium]|nr:hypothetical protein [Flavobacteriales bacterium]
MDTTAATFEELRYLNSAFYLMGCKWDNALKRVVHLDRTEMPHPDAPEDFRGQSIFHISVKPSGMKIFRAKAAQLKLFTAVYEEMARGTPCYIIILKARQIGFTTAIGLLILALSLLKEATNAMIAAHIDDSAYSIFEIYKRAYHFLPYDENDPDNPHNLKPKKEADNLTMLKFEENQSSMRSFVAKEGSLGVSKPHTYAHFSEMALWRGDAGQTLATALDSIPKVVGSIVFIETTSRGRGNAFHKLWESASASDERFQQTGERTDLWRPLFFSWMDDEDYRVTPPATWVKSADEVLFQLKARCDDAQLYWRNRKISEKMGTLGYEGAVAHFNRENPTTPEDAFAFAGDATFDAMGMAWLRKRFETRDPDRYDVFLAKSEVGVPGGAYPIITPNIASGPLRIFSMPREDGRYMICADPTRNEGDKPDDAAMHILDIDNIAQVGAFTLPIDPYDFADVIVAAALFFNNAFVVCENNNAGLGTVLRIVKELKYANVYYHGKSPGQAISEHVSAGFPTNKTTRPELITNGKRFIKELRVVLHDPETFDEMESYRREWDAERGKYVDEERPGESNNLVMALLIGLLVGNLKYRWFNKARRHHRSPAPMKPEGDVLTVRRFKEVEEVDKKSPAQLLSWREGE